MSNRHPKFNVRKMKLLIFSLDRLHPRFNQLHWWHLHLTHHSSKTNKQTNNSSGVIHDSLLSLTPQFNLTANTAHSTWKLYLRHLTTFVLTKSPDWVPCFSPCPLTDYAQMAYRVNLNKYKSNHVLSLLKNPARISILFRIKSQSLLQWFAK